MINLALIGLGYWGKNYLRVIKDSAGVKLAYICDVNENLELLPNDAKFTTNYEDIANDDKVDACIIATPASSHYKIAKTLLENNKHVLVEKPLTMNSKEAEELLRIADEQRLVLMAGHIYCYHPAIRYLKEFIKRKRAGQIYYGMAVRIGLGPIRSDASCTWDLATHDIAIADYLFEKKPISVTATATSFLQKQKGIYDYAHIHLEYEDMHLGITASWYAAEKIRSIWLAGSKCLIKFDDMNKEWPIMIYQSQVKKEEKFDLKRFLGGKILMPRLAKDEPLILQVKHFIDCIKTKRRPITDGNQGLKVVSILEAVEKSIKIGRKIKLG